MPSEPVSSERVEGVILGGGISGLSAGWRWSRAGFHDYRLLELEDQVGGNSRALAYKATSAPIGAHYLPLPNEEARAVRRLLREMGYLDWNGSAWQVAQEHLCHSRQERVYYRDSWHDGLVPRAELSDSALRQFEAFDAHIEGWRERRDQKGNKVFALPLHYSSREPEFLALDKLSFAEHIRSQGWDDPYLLWYLNYACRDDFGGTIDNCSAWAGLHYFASRDGGGLGHPGDILVWPEGNNRLARFLREQQLGEVATGSLVVAVDHKGDGVTVDYLDLASQQLKRLEAKVALFCLPSFMRGRLIADDVATDAFVYPPWLTANLALDRTPEDIEAPGFIAWDNVIHGSESLGYVVATHQMLNTDPNKATVWTWYRPFPEGPALETRKELLETSWKTWADTVLDELTPLHSNIRKLCSRLDVTVLGHGMIRPSVDFVWSQSLSRARKAQGSLFFGHGDLSGMSLFEESQFQGVSAAESALAHLGNKVESYL